MADIPRFVSISPTSSRVTCPSLSRSSTWNASLISRTCAGGSFDSASLSAIFDQPIIPIPAPFAARVGDMSCWGYIAEGVVERPRGIQSPPMEGGVLTFWSLDGDWMGVCVFVGELVGVVGRIVVEGERGDEGRWKGVVRGEPKERGDGL